MLELFLGKPYIVSSKKSIDVLVGDTVRVNVSFYSNDGSQPGISWFKVMNDSKSEVLISHEERHHISTFDEDVLLSYYDTDILQRGTTTQLSINNVKSDDFMAFKVKINNTIGTADYTVTLVQIGQYKCMSAVSKGIPTSI